MKPLHSLHHASAFGRRAALLLAAGFVMAPATGQGQQAEPREVRVEVEFEGLEGDLEANVEAVVSLAVQDGDPLPASRARRLWSRAPDEIRLALEPFGRYAPVIEAELNDAGEENWTARFVVDPGPAIVIQRVDFAVTGPGAADSGFVALADSFPLAVGDTLHHTPYEVAKAEFSRYATNRGYFDARFDSAQIRVDRGAATAEIVFLFETGERHRFGPIRVEQDVLDPAFVDGYVTVSEGDPFDGDALRASQRALTTGPWFGRADIELDLESAEDLAVPVTFRLTPSRPQAYEVAVGYGTDTGFRGSLRAHFRRLNRRAHDAEGEIRISQIEKSVAARYNIPRPFPSGVVWSLFGSAGDVSPDWSTTRGGTVGVSYGHYRGPVRETFSLLWERSNYEAAGIEGNSTLVVGQADWSWVRSNDPVIATRGHRVALTLAGAHDALLSTATYATARLSGKIIRPLGGRMRAIGRAEVGRIFTDDLGGLPPTRRFVTGGDATVRGYGFESLGPAVGDSLLFGGDALLVGSVEADFEVIPNWRIAGFADAGNASDGFSDLDLSWGVGGGIRWASPLGLIRFDLGFPVTDSSRTLQLHLVIGPDL